MNIFIPTLFGIIFIVCFLEVMTSKKNNINKDIAGATLLLLFFAFLTIIIVQKNQLENCKECPELEKVDNVYKIKTK